MRGSIPNLFFLNSKLHKKLRHITQEAAVVAWNYPDQKRSWYLVADVLRGMQVAYRISEVADILSRPPEQIRGWLRSDIVSYPSGRTFDVKTKIPKALFWSEDDILRMRDEILEIAPKNKYGEPLANFRLPSRQDVLARLHPDSSYYVKDDDGNFIKVWKV